MSRAKRLRKSAFISGKEYVTSSFQESAALEQLSSTANAALAAASVPPPPSDKITMEIWPVGNISANSLVAVDPTTASGSYLNGYPLADTFDDIHMIDHGTSIIGVAEEAISGGAPGTITIMGPCIIRTAGNSTPYGGITAGTTLYPYFETFPYIVDGFDQGLQPIAVALEDYGETGVGTNKIRAYINPPETAMTWPDGVALRSSLRVRVLANGAMAGGTLVVGDNSSSSGETRVRAYDPGAGDVWGDIIGLTPYAVTNNGAFSMVINGEVGRLAIPGGGAAGIHIYSDSVNPELLTTVSTSGNRVGWATRDDGAGNYTIHFTPAR